MSELQDKVVEIFSSLNKQMDAHLAESIISLFNQGVLKHHVRSPRFNLNQDNFNMTVEAANGVKFEGREKIIEQQQQINLMERLLKKYEAQRAFYGEIENWSFLNNYTIPITTAIKMDDEIFMDNMHSFGGKRARELANDEDFIKYWSEMSDE